MKRTALLLVMAVLASIAPTRAQAPDDPPATSIAVAHVHDSGLLANADSVETRRVVRHVVHHPGASSLRVVFGVIDLGEADWVEVWNPADGERHRLDAVEIGKWELTSAWFNGDTLEVSLFLAPGSAGRFAIEELFVGVAPIATGVDTICGAFDDRLPSTDVRSARFVTSPTAGGGGCTIWPMSPDSCALSAGHCFTGGTLLVAEFNVPLSNPNGSFNHPPVADQFTVDPTTISLSTGIGNDWGICKLNPNNLGQTAAVRNGHFDLGMFVPNAGDTLRVTGYGTDGGTANQTLQTHTGPFNSLDGGNILRYVVDTTGGNSGSPVLDEATGLAVGIHTHGGCTSTGGQNSGTTITNPALVAAINALCSFGSPAAPIASFNVSSPNAVVGRAVHFSSTSTGIPTQWSWDLDGNGIADANTSNASFVYAAPGVYSVTLTVSNSLGTDALTQTGLINVVAPSSAALPYTQDFSGGLPSTGEWLFQSELTSGAIGTGTSGSTSPVSGGAALTMATTSTIGGPFVTNEAILFVDAASAGAVILSYWFKSVGDENDPEDGVFVSDGTTEIRVSSHQNATGNWTEVQLDLTSLVLAGGLSFTPDFRIIFRQRDNFALGTDGVLIDDIRVLPTPAPDVGQPNSSAAALTFAGARDQNGLFPLDDVGPFFVTVAPGGLLSFAVSGTPNRPFVLLSGPLNRQNAAFGAPFGQLDLGLNGGALGFSDVLILLDGATPVGPLDYLAATGELGVQPFAFSVPVLPPGALGAVQAVILQPGGLATLTAATEIAIP